MARQQVERSGKSEWLRDISPLTQLCIVTDPSIPDRDAQAMAQHFSDVPQVAILRIHDVASLRVSWIASHRQAVSITSRADPDDTLPLREIPRSVHLLIWSDVPEALEWIGSVHGHVASHVHMGGDHESGSPVRRAIGSVYVVLRAVIQTNFGIDM